jgi:hypothetical protein
VDWEKKRIDGERSWIVKLEVLTILLLNLALIAFGLLAWIGFAAVSVESGIFTEAPGSPFQVGEERDPIIEKGFKPLGYFLGAASLGLPAAFLLSLALLLHRMVVVPLAEEEDASRARMGSSTSPPRASRNQAS